MSRGWKQFNTEMPLPKNEQQEFSKSKLGLIFCKECNAVYYKKSWHHNLRHYKNLKDSLPVKFSLCLACLMIKNKQFEGEIVIKEIPLKIHDDLVNLVKSFSRRAYQRDSMDRLIEIKDISSKNLKITTTENQLAVKLAKKIQEVFKSSTKLRPRMKISYSPAPSDVVYIKMTFD